MVYGSLAFAAGDLLLQAMPVLPSLGWLGLLPLCLLLLRVRRLRLLAWFGLGFLWTAAHAAWLLGDALPTELQGRDLLLVGRVLSLPERDPARLRFLFRVEHAVSDGQPVAVPPKVLLSWYETDAQIRYGERWRLPARLKQPHGLANPGGFDYECWLWQQGIRATGYVRDSARAEKLAAPEWRQVVGSIRERLRAELQRRVGSGPATALLTALVIGDRSAITARQWEVLRSTGANHLFAISGLHIGILAGLIFFLCRRLWSLSGALPLFLPAPRAAALAAVAAAALYALLAGFSVSTQRALVMLFVVMGALWFGRTLRPARILALALLTVLILDPRALLAAGFWLSFGAVAAIFYGVAGRQGAPALWRGWGRTQWAVFVGLLPLLLLLFHQISLVAPLVNLALVPWFSLVLVPLALGGTLLLCVPAVGDTLLQAAAQLLAWTFSGLEWVADLPWIAWASADPPIWSWPAALLGTALLLAPRGLPGRWLGAVLLAPVFTLPRPGPEPGEFWFTLLDVGQGLSAVVRTRDHVLVFDTGPRLASGFDTAEAVVLPYLRAQGIRQLDLLILSNGDNDHAGGAATLTARIGVAAVLSGEPEVLGSARRCNAGESWLWNGVRFSLLHPDAGRWRGNNASCVLRIENSANSVLLTADIEAAAERHLVRRLGRALASSVVVVPHHGSKTSSRPAFARAVRPQFALVSAGYRNRYGFPAAPVVERWEALGARVVSTARSGAIEFRFAASGPVPNPRRSRMRSRRYWTHLP